MDIIQILSFDGIPAEEARYQRTQIQGRPSEANVMHCLRNRILGFLLSRGDSEIVQLIRGVQMGFSDRKALPAA